MTVDELIALARSMLDRYALLGIPSDKLPADEMRLAYGILDLFQREMPCGAPRPVGVRERGHGGRDYVAIPVDSSGEWDLDDARAFAVAILRAADEADHG